MRRFVPFAFVALFAVAAAGAAAQRPSAPQRPSTAVIDVHKDATCGCCANWVEQLRKAGFTVNTTDDADMAAFKTKHGVPRRAQSCHTGVVNGYVLEGHVPIADIQRLLKERPAVAGLAVPGMPVGSPGMEMAGVKPQPYDVLAFDKQGGTTVFASYNK